MYHIQRSALNHSAILIGFTVLGLDFFLGDPVYIHLDEPGFDRLKWNESMHALTRDILPKWWAAVKEQYGT